MKRILFLCTGNSCRSQMAQAMAQKALGRAVQVYSAGIERHGLNPRAVQVMSEIGIDISQAQSNLLSEYSHLEFQRVYTVCDHAYVSCAVFPGSCELRHRSFDDPPTLTRQFLEDEEILPVYRRVRDEIQEWLEEELPSL